MAAGAEPSRGVMEDPAGELRAGEQRLGGIRQDLGRQGGRVIALQRDVEAARALAARYPEARLGVAAGLF